MNSGSFPLESQPGVAVCDALTPDALEREPSCFLPNRRDLWALAGATLALRLVVFAAVTLGLGVSVQSYAERGDGMSYMLVARAMAGQVLRGELDEYHRRVFPGYPALIAPLVRTGIPAPWAALTVGWAGAIATSVLSAIVFRDRRVGWAMVFLVPHYLINSSMAMSESPMLAFALGGMVAARAGRGGLAGALLGAAGLIRPMACFAAAAALVLEWEGGRRKLAVKIALTAALTFAAGVLAVHLWTRGDAMEGVRIYRDSNSAYGGRIFLWPGESLLLTPFRFDIPVWMIPYVWLHVILIFGACSLIVARLRRRAESPDDNDSHRSDVLAAPWLLGNTLFQLCIGSYWGFTHFPRFTFPSHPALFWVTRRWLPTRRRAWIALGAVSTIIAVIGVYGSP